MGMREIEQTAADMEAARKHAAEFGVDLKRFEPYEIGTNTWEGMKKGGELVQQGQIKIRWRELVKESQLSVIEQFAKKNITARDPIKPQAKKSSKKFALLSIPDLHYGALCWRGETGINYDLELAAKAFRATISHFSAVLKDMQPATIIFPLGSDYLHIDNDKNTTAKGTLQDVDGRIGKVLITGTQLFIEAVEQLAEISPVEIPLCRGNHDENTSLTVAIGTAAYFSKSRHINVDFTQNSRKYFQRGNVMICIDHGDGVKFERLPDLMANEQPKMWANSKYRYAARGHLHSKKSYYVQTEAQTSGVEVCYLPSLKPADKWHSDNGFTMSPFQAIMHVYDEAKGKESEIYYNHNY